MAEATQSIHEALARATTGQALNCPRTIATLAELAAMKAVKRELKAQGVKFNYVEHQTIVAAARSYLREHPELFEKAAESVRIDPILRTLAEREDRKRRGYRR